MNALEGLAQLGIGLVVERVEVGAYGAREEDGVLRDDGQARAQVVKLDGGDIDAIDMNAAGASLDEAEEGKGERGFSGAGAADDADALVAVNAEANALEDRRKVGGVADDEVLDFDAAVGGPRGGRADAFEGLGRKGGVLNRIC